MSADVESIQGILDELQRQRRGLASGPGDRRLLAANGRAIEYWQSALARRLAASSRGYTGRRARM
jgi:hypothetical protein